MLHFGQIRVEGCDNQPDFVQISWACPVHGQHVYAGRWSRLDELVDVICRENPGAEAEALHELFTVAALNHERERAMKKVCS
jgi:hypothetical protein